MRPGSTSASPMYVDAMPSSICVPIVLPPKNPQESVSDAFFGRFSCRAFAGRENGA